MAPFRDRRMEAGFPSWGLPGSRAARLVFGDLAAYLRQPLETVAEAYWRHRDGDDLAAQRRVGEATEAADVLAYYAATPHYLYELSYWEASPDKQAWFRVIERACRRHRLRRVLDFGGGVGGLCLFLNARGIRCDYLDVGGKTFEYAAWRFARHRLDVAMHDAASGDGHSSGSYDAVVAWDVLEHLFDLEGAIRRIAALLRPRGWFLSKSTFAVSGTEHEAIHLAQHARYADVAELNRLMARSGFRFVGQLKPDRLSRLLRLCGLRQAVAGIRIAPRLKHGGNFLIHERGGTEAGDA
ncbi:MAG: class I SAM-dependent methyltransferase [Candidatus Omnitrophica bacterium]|nr:class I SAM-dependent methyltransferase [Candidatus Omnitrophota bacterium]